MNHTHKFSERLSPGNYWRCQCGARMWDPEWTYISPVHRPTSGERAAAELAHQIGGELDALREQVVALRRERDALATKLDLAHKMAHSLTLESARDLEQIELHRGAAESLRQRLQSAEHGDDKSQAGYTLTLWQCLDCDQVYPHPHAPDCRYVRYNEPGDWFDESEENR